MEEWGEDHCDDYSPHTQRELDEQDARFARGFELIARGLSPCCEALLDMSQVITSGAHKGHGPRICSKCRKVVMVV
jgi:hypothetical protein